MGRKLIDLTGQKFGRLIVQERTENDEYNHIMWLCLCDCDKQHKARGDQLKIKEIQSCGCLKMELISKLNLKHNHCKNRKESKIYLTWRNMIQRCNNKNNPYYKDYGGRDKPIVVCYRWSNKNPKGFENFLKDIEEIPGGLTLDRIDNNGNYEPNNWRLATIKEQNRNKRNNYLIPFDGKELCITEWSDITGIKVRTIKIRLLSGWPIKKALTTPVKIRRKKNNA